MNTAAKESKLDQPAGFPTPLSLGPLPQLPLVSILISNYNYAAYLEDAIRSSLQQTYGNLEVVICDDGSKDASSEILERFQSGDPRIKVVYQDHGGQSLALNAAFHKCSGDVICLLDADDVFLPDKVHQVVGAFASAPNSGLAVNRMVRVDKLRRDLGEVPLISPLPSGWIRPFISLSAPHAVGGLPPCSGLSLRRPVAEAIFPLPARLKAYADTLIQILAPLITPVVAIQSPLSEYRFHGANVAAIPEFTEEKLRNLSVFEREVWLAWRRFLVSPHFGIPPSSLPSEMPLSPMSYAYERFRSHPISTARRQAISPEYFQTWPRSLQWYWRASSLMPTWLFRRSFAFVYGQTPAKLALAKLLKVCRNCLPACQQPDGRLGTAFRVGDAARHV